MIFLPSMKNATVHLSKINKEQLSQLVKDIHRQQKSLKAMFVALAMLVYNPLAYTQNSLEKSTMSENNTIELIHGSGQPTHAVIWLHGLGATANDFPPIVPELGLSQNRVIRFVFPQAPDRPITINGGMVMPGWYDIKGMDIADKQDAVGMTESQATLDRLIDEQIALKISAGNIIIAGFSQGGAVAYHVGVRSNHKLGGILALSTYIPFSEQVATEHSKVNIQTPILANHGTHDPVVPIQLGQASADLLVDLGYLIKWQTYPMEHQVVMEQIKDVGAWINQTFDAD